MSEASKSATPVERMIISAARLIEDDTILLVGTQWPIIVSLLAWSLHAPRISICYEGGVILGRFPDRIPFFTGDPVSNGCSILMGSTFDTMGGLLHAGRAHMALLSAASVDRYGNINTTCIGPYGRPAIRFGGSGGACDFASLSPRTIIILEHDRRRFPAAVDFVTSPGYLQGENTRESAGLRKGTGPHAVVTTLGVFGFDEAGEMVLTGHQASTSVKEIRENVQWDLKVDPQVSVLDAPTSNELATLRQRVDPQGMYLRNARFLEHKDIII
ncbi:MAG: CoA-transferase subunit beta [Desulfobacteraceae bacterium]